MKFWAFNLALVLGAMTAIGHDTGGGTPDPGGGGTPANCLPSAMPLYRNLTNTINPAPIDATAFENSAGFFVGTPILPFDFQNTLFFTNKASGSMSSSSGFRFDYFACNRRHSAENFVNSGQISTLSNLFVWATNINARGNISAGVQGRARFNGNNIVMSQLGISAGLSFNTSFLLGSGIGFGNNEYLNPFGIWDLYWGAIDSERLRVDQFQAGIPSSRRHRVTDPYFGSSDGTRNNFVSAGPGFFSTNFFGTNLYNTYAITNDAPSTDGLTVDRVIQVIYASVPQDNNVVIRAGFQFPDGGTPPSSSAVVEYSVGDTDVVNARPFTNYLTFLDHSATSNNVVLFQNAVRPGFFRPSSFEVRRSVNFGSFFFFGSRNIGDVGPNTYYGSSSNVVLGVTNVVAFTNREVDHRYAAYSFMVDSGIGRVPSLFSDPELERTFYDPTNLPGRVEIFGGDLNLDRLRARGENLIWIDATNHISANGALLDAPNIILHLHSTNETLVLSNLFPSFVKRLSGNVEAWSGVWSNSQLVSTTSATASNAVTFNIKYHVLIIDCNDNQFNSTTNNPLHAAEPVRLTRFSATASNIVIATNLTVGQSFLLESDTLTINSNATLNFGNELPDLTFAQLPNIRNFTNYGSIFVPSVFALGVDPSVPLDNIVNFGFISAGAARLRGGNVVNNGNISAGVLELDGSVNVVGGSLSAFSEITLSGENVFFIDSTLFAGGPLILNVTNWITDEFSTGFNSWLLTDGMQLNQKPALGDLLFTTIQSTAGPFIEARHLWAGEDRGVTAGGYFDNAAVGYLALDGTNSNGSFSTFRFTGTGTSNAIYIDYLEMRNDATNFLDRLVIDDNIVVYFADSNLPVEKLNGSQGGRLRWVPAYAGFNSSTNITYPNGQTYTFNSALVRSTDLDSDGDGTFNAFDPTPLPEPGGPIPANVTVTISSNAPLRMLISWNAAPDSTNTVESQNSVLSGPWQVLTNFVQGPSSQRVTVSDPLNGGTKFYRVRIDPR